VGLSIPAHGNYLIWKVKVKSSLCLTKHHATEAYWRSVGIASRVFNLGTSGGKWSVSHNRPLYPRGKSLRYPLNGRLGAASSRNQPPLNAVLSQINAVHFNISLSFASTSSKWSLPMRRSKHVCVFLPMRVTSSLNRLKIIV